MLFKTPVLDAQEAFVLQRIEEIHRKLNNATRQGGRWTGLLRRTSLAKAIRGSNTIEGYNVTVEDAIAAVEGEEPIDADAETWAAIKGYRDALTYVLQLAPDPHFRYEVALLRSLHYMMISYDLSKHPGTWRPGFIAVRNDETGDIVYEGPDVELVPDLMQELVAWLNATEPGTPAIVRAAMGHLNLVMIHPFSDGNGRMARCLQTLMLTREGILAQPFSSIEEHLGRHENTQEYYRVLGLVGRGKWNPDGDAKPWIRFVLSAHFFQASTYARRLTTIGKLWDTIAVEIKKRGLPERMDVALMDAAMGLRVRNATYRNAAQVTNDVASRDLKALVDAQLLEGIGENKGRFYVATERIKWIANQIRTDSRQEIKDPFSTPFSPIEQQQLFGQ
jgi:Fic family protein